MATCVTRVLRNIKNHIEILILTFPFLIIFAIME